MIDYGRRFPPHYAQLVRALEAKFDAIEAAEARIDQAADPGAAVRALNVMREEALVVAIQVFAWGTIGRMNDNSNPTIEERAAMLVAQRLMERPRDAHDIKNWRVPVPYAFAPEGTKLDWTEAEKKQQECCVVVCRLIAGGVTLDEAMERAAMQFHRGRSWVQSAYYGNRERFEPLVRLARG